MKQTTKNIVFSAMFIAIGVLLPQIFHIFGGVGPVFLPMHLSVILGGMLLGAKYGVIIGIITPIISFIVTGGVMPPISPVPILYFMICELGAYGFLSGFINEKLKVNSYVVLLLSMILGRIALTFSVFLFLNLFYQHLKIGLTPFGYVKGAILTGVPGIIIQIIVIPVLYNLLKKYFNTNK